MTYDTEPPAEPPAPPPPPPPPPPDPGPPEARAIAALFRVAARDGWARTTMAAIGAESGLSLAELRGEFPCREAILDRFARETDQAVLAGTMPVSEGETIKDRLFDMLMRRLDAFQPHRAGVLAVADGLRRDPAGALARLPVALNSMLWMLDGAGVRAHGMGRLLRAKALLAVALYTFRAWAEDESQDMAKTMAALDRALSRAEQAESWCARLPGRSQA
jgi:ubiquinone biosynthesis protein COQ9